MVQVGKYLLYLIAFFLLINTVVWIKYVIKPEERKTVVEKRLSYEEAERVYKGNVNFEDYKYYEKHSALIKITPTYFLSYDYDTLDYKREYVSKECGCNND